MTTYHSSDINTPTITPLTHKVAEADLPSSFGSFKIAGFSPDNDGKEHIAIYKGDIKNATDVPTRIHSECLTGDVLGSLRCDCRQQLHKALHKIEEDGFGLLLYLRQEGRGIGLANKLKAYALQEQGMDTVEANKALGFADDLRDYKVAADMIKALEIKSVILMTNNPKKVNGLKDNGVIVEERMPHAVESNEHNHYYLKTKNKKSGHLIPESFILA